VITNIIVDDNTQESDVLSIHRLFDSVADNPMWDGPWDRERAEARFAEHFPWTAKG
jgi:hypothetical protein